MPIFFQNRPGKGRPLCLKGVAAGLLRLERAWQTLSVHNGHVEWDKFTPTIILDGQEKDEQEIASVEWSQEILNASSIRTYAGPVQWANVTLNAGYSDYYDVSYSGLSTGDVRWLFVEIDLKQSGAAAAATVKFQADASLPVDSPSTLVVRWRLSKWQKTAAGIQRLITAWPGGCIHLAPVTYGPP